jgi:hypothetical protein
MAWLIDRLGDREPGLRFLQVQRDELDLTPALRAVRRAISVDQLAGEGVEQKGTQP